MEIAKLIDHTNLKADASVEDIKKTCQEAKKYGFRGVCINPKWVKLAKKELEGTNIKVVTVIDWPCGASSVESRVCQSKVAKKEGASEIDPVLNIGDFKTGDYKKVSQDLKTLAGILPTKLIIETGYLSDEEVKKAASLVKEAGCYCVKTSTGMKPKVDLDTKCRHIELISEVVGSSFPIKAAGGIRTPADVLKLLEAGAGIIGTSSGVEIVTGKKPKEKNGY
jgi:deoxyribose-phosphate aldolase